MNEWMSEWNEMKSKRGEMEYNGERIKLNAPYKNDAQEVEEAHEWLLMSACEKRILPSSRMYLWLRLENVEKLI